MLLNSLADCCALSYLNLIPGPGQPFSLNEVSECIEVNLKDRWHYTKVGS